MFTTMVIVMANKMVVVMIFVSMATFVRLTIRPALLRRFSGRYCAPVGRELAA